MNQKELLEAIEKMNALELNDLAKAIQEKFDISAMPTMGAAAPAEGSDSEASTDFDVKIVDVPADKKMAVIKAVKDIFPSLGGLAGSKKFVEDAGRDTAAKVMGVSSLKKEQADELAKKLTDAGCKVEVVNA